MITYLPSWLHLIWLIDIVSLSKNLKIFKSLGKALFETSKILKTPFSVPIKATFPSTLTSSAVGLEKKVMRAS